jgi:hypothetical protein
MQKVVGRRCGAIKFAFTVCEICRSDRVAGKQTELRTDSHQTAPFVEQLAGFPS